MLITYKNASIDTINYEEISEEEREILKQKFFEKPSFEVVISQFKKITKDGVMIDKITRYYFRDIMAKTIIHGSKWSVEDVFNSKELLGIFVAKIKTNPTIFSNTEKIKNIDTAIRLGGHSIAQFPPQFPLPIAQKIIDKYNINNNLYDFSCGWGARLLAAMTRSINYFGTDPNFLLTERLNQLYNDYKENIGLNSIVKIYTQGSEIFIPELDNKIGLAFSSPPYFDVEDYQIGEQSYTPFTTYESWINNFLKPTINNIYKYLIPEGILALNIKNNSRHKLADDAKKIVQEHNFELIDIELLTNNQRITPDGKINNAENIFIFKKQKDKQIINISSKLNQDNKKIINNLEETSQLLDIYLIGVKSKKQLNDLSIYNSENQFLGERYFGTFQLNLSNINFLTDYQIGQYMEIDKQTVQCLLNYCTSHRDNNNSFKTVYRLCEILDTWDEMEAHDFHLFLQINSN